MELTEVSEIEIKTFSIEDISKKYASITSTGEFDQLNLHEKLNLLGKVKEKDSFSNDTIGLGDAFERAMNLMYNGNGDVALIVEKRVLTLNKNIQRKAIQGTF